MAKWTTPTSEFGRTPFCQAFGLAALERQKTEPTFLTRVAVKGEPGSSGTQIRLLIDYDAMLRDNVNSLL